MPTPSAAVVGLTHSASVAAPAHPEAPAHASAWPFEMRPDGSGRLHVRFIRPSRSASISWLNELAEAEQRKVPPSAAPIVSGSTAPGAIK